MSNINFNNDMAQHGSSSSNDLFHISNNDWPINFDDPSTFGSDIAPISFDNVANFNTQGCNINLFGSASNSGQIYSNMLLNNDSQLDGQYGSGNDISNEITESSVNAYPLNVYRQTADPALPTTEATNHSAEVHCEEQRRFVQGSSTQAQSTMSSDAQAETQYAVHFPSFDTYPADVLMITQKRDRRSPYADHSSRYTSTSMARVCREKTRMYPRFTCKYNQDPTDEYDDTADDVVNNWLSWKERVFNALINLQGVEDKKSSSGYKHFAEKFYATKMIEARCCEVVELCVDLHVNGTKVDDWHNLALQTPSDLDLKCRERLERICDFLEREKMACENVMAGTDAIRRMVLAPIAAWKRKLQNRRGNTYKSQELQFAKTVRSSRERDTEDDADPTSAAKGRKRTHSRTISAQGNTDPTSSSSPAAAVLTRGGREDQQLTKRRRILPVRQSIYAQGESSSSATRRATRVSTLDEPLPADLTAADIFASGSYVTGSHLAGLSSSPSSANKPRVPHSSSPNHPAPGSTRQGSS